MERGAAALLRHWLQHYLQLGIDREQFLLLVHHDPAVPGGMKALQQVLAALDEQGMNYRCGGRCVACLQLLDFDMALLWWLSLSRPTA